VALSLRPSVRSMFFHKCSTRLGCGQEGKDKLRGVERVQVGLIEVRWGQFCSWGVKGGQVGSSKVRLDQLRSESDKSQVRSMRYG
jgi:hypothetical protein